MLSPGRVVLDPSRVAAQVVSGIGFIGGGLIFVRRDAVRGLTTAAGIWLTAAVGMAAGAGLPVLAVAATAGYFLVAYGYPAIARRLPSDVEPASLSLTYIDGQGILRDALGHCTGAGFSVADVAVDRRQPNPEVLPTAVIVRLGLSGQGSLTELASDLGDLDGVLSVSAEGNDNHERVDRSAS